jgi:peptidoglycan/LPS O-acetylase OafA/YrhL
VANLLLAICVIALVFYMRLSWAKTITDARTYLLSVPPLAVMLVALVSGRTFLTGLLENPILITLGEASYSLYLVHLFFLPPNNASHSQYIFAVICAVATSVIFYFFLEKPARNLWRQILVDGKRATRQFEAKSYSVE